MTVAPLVLGEDTPASVSVSPLRSLALVSKFAIGIFNDTLRERVNVAVPATGATLATLNVVLTALVKSLALAVNCLVPAGSIRRLVKLTVPVPAPGPMSRGAGP